MRISDWSSDVCSSDLTAPILGDWTADFGYYAGRELLSVRDFTAIFSSNDQMALGLLHAVREEGLDVPGDISIVGFDDIPEAAHFSPPLTTVRQDFPELGRRRVDLLLGPLDPSAEPVPAAIPPELIVRSSTGPAPRGSGAVPGNIPRRVDTPVSWGVLTMDGGR